jgi:hypothetical protein
MTSEFLRVYEEIAAAFRFDGTGCLTHKYAGAKTPPPQIPPKNALWSAWALNAAWPIIYRWHYLRQMRSQTEIRGFRHLRDGEDGAFADNLSSANRSSGFIESGWTIVGRAGEEYLCAKDGVRLRVSTSLLEIAGEPHELGDKVPLRLPAERRYALASYYCAGGGRAKETDFRVYFHVKPGSAAWLVEKLTTELGGLNASYSFKIVNHPGGFTRPDAAVLYMNRAELDHGRMITENIAREGARAFRMPTPAFAKRLYPGIAAADEPPNFDGRRPSFGEHRSRILARGLTRAAVESMCRVEEIATVLRNELRNEGIDPERPFSSGSPSCAAHF